MSFKAGTLTVSIQINSIRLTHVAWHSRCFKLKPLSSTVPVCFLLLLFADCSTFFFFLLHRPSCFSDDLLARGDDDEDVFTYMMDWWNKPTWPGRGWMDGGASDQTFQVVDGPFHHLNKSTLSINFNSCFKTMFKNESYSILTWVITIWATTTFMAFQSSAQTRMKHRRGSLC